MLKHIVFFAIVALAIAVPIQTAADVDAAIAAWKAGVAAVDITPDSPMLMAGYAVRTGYGANLINKLSAKAIVLEDAQRRRAVLVTLDLVGIARDFSQSICEELRKKHGFERPQVLIVCSHTHSGPVVGHNLRPMHYDLASKHDQQVIDRYAARLQQQIVAAVGRASGALEPAGLAWAGGKTTFAVNRRNNVESDVPRLREQAALKGPVDHDVPVLRIRRADGRLLAVVFGYACHATVLSGNAWSSDYPGFAQTELEKNHPGCTAMFVTGCAGDQNPIPRGNVAQAEQYGHDLAVAVDAVLVTPMTPLAAKLDARYREIELPLGAIPSKPEVDRDAASRNKYVASRARYVLRQLRPDGSFPQTYPYPVAVWRLGELTLCALGGEVVVDYSLRLKLERRPMWVAAYSNDIMAYIPSRRVLAEGGYEGGGAMLYYGLSAPWGPEAEDRIIRAVHELAANSGD